MRYQAEEWMVKHRESQVNDHYYKSGQWIDLEHLNYVLKQFKKRAIAEMEIGQTEFVCYMIMKNYSEAEFVLNGRWEGNQFTAEKLSIEYILEPIHFETDPEIINFVKI